MVGDLQRTMLIIIALLAPLTSAASLPDHPSLSVPYLSSTLSDMAQHACESLQRERKTLENAKLLLLKLRGDKTWIPTEQLNTSYDDEIFGTSHLFHTIVASSSDDWTQTTVNAEPLNNVHQNVPIPSIAEAELGNVNGVAPPPESGDELREEVADLKKSTSVGETTKALATPSPHPAAKATVNGAGLEENGLSGGVQTNGETIGHENNHNGEEATSAESFKKSNLQKPVTEEPVVNEELPSLDQNYDSKDTNEAAPDGAHDANGENAGQDGPDSKLNGSDEMEDNEDEHSAPRRMRTRAQAHAASEAADSSRSPSVEAVYIPPPVHPIFLIPPSAKPDENYGLSAPEAEETRRMLMIYVQKQEEVVRNAEQLYKNLLKADRLRLTVLKWCKAEGHVGEMSDGEDWYDKEEWGLEDDLRKGEADERLADDDVGVQGKKTRGRRA